MPITYQRPPGIGVKPPSAYFNQNLVTNPWQQMGMEMSLQNAANQMAQQQWELDQQARKTQMDMELQRKFGQQIDQQQFADMQFKLDEEQRKRDAVTQRNMVFQSIGQVDPRSPQGRSQVSSILGQNPLAAADPDVLRYLNARGYDPDQEAYQKQREDYRTDSWMSQLPEQYFDEADALIRGGEDPNRARAIINSKLQNDRLLESLAGNVSEEELTGITDPKTGLLDRPKAQKLLREASRRQAIESKLRPYQETINEVDAELALIEADLQRDAENIEKNKLLKEGVDPARTLGAAVVAEMQKDRRALLAKKAAAQKSLEQFGGKPAAPPQKEPPPTTTAPAKGTTGGKVHKLW